jgi:hypothetical protein
LPFTANPPGCFEPSPGSNSQENLGEGSGHKSLKVALCCFAWLGIEWSKLAKTQSLAIEINEQYIMIRKHKIIQRDGHSKKNIKPKPND